MWRRLCSTVGGCETDSPAVNTPAPTLYNRRMVGWLSLGQLITWGSVFYGFALLMEPVERELGLSRAQSSLAFSLALLAEGALAWPVGRWIDRGHERAVMTGGSLVIVAGLLLQSMVHSALGFYAAWTLLGAGLAARAVGAGGHALQPCVLHRHAALSA